MSTEHIRNFSIIAHIDHGKSTLADRMLECTGTIEKRKMKEQVLDMMELERERGITIKMQPVRMVYRSESGISNLESRITRDSEFELHDSKYILNLIDTPGHIDFSYEVSRALRAVEGALLLVDATQGVQAQTLSVLQLARELELTIIPVINKIDLPIAEVEAAREQIVQLLHCDPASIVLTSGKTGAGVPELLEKIVTLIPAPRATLPTQALQSLVFDFSYDTHRGMIVYVRIMNGELRTGETLTFCATGDTFQALDVGVFAPEKQSTGVLHAGEIGYIVTGMKKPGGARVGDTVISIKQAAPALSGYSESKPMVWASLYPEEQDDFAVLRQALERLKLSDAALSYEEESSGAIGRGFRCGFLGMLHLEIVTERLRREFSLQLIVTAPTILYELELKNGKRERVYAAVMFPEESSIAKVFETWVTATIITPPSYVGALMQLFYDHEVVVGATELFGDNRTSLTIEMPLRELMRNFFDELKSASSGYASLSYTPIGLREADVVRLDLLVADEMVGAFSKVVSRRRVQEEAESMVERLKEVLPRQMFDFKIQAQAMGRIISSRAVSGMKKDVTDYLYGGDITRKMKLREKQKKGKKKMKARGRVEIPQDVFLKMMKPKE